VSPDLAYQAELFAQERAFWWCVINRTPPEEPRYEGAATVDDPETITLAAQYATQSARLESLRRKLDKLKAKLLSRCTARVNTIGALTVTRTPGRTGLDQKGLEAAGIDLSRFRTKASDYWTIRMK
jgi:hypothetical protein